MGRRTIDYARDRRRRRRGGRGGKPPLHCRPGGGGGGSWKRKGKGGWAAASLIREDKKKDETEGGRTEEKKEDEMEVDANATKVVVSADVEIGNPGSMTIKLCRIVAKDDPYYPKHPDSDNPYRGGYFTKLLRKSHLS